MKNTERILVAEDDPQDAFFLKREFGKAGIPISLHFVQDGQEVLDYLEGKGAFADRQTHPMPDLVLLDLKMPRMNGFDLATRIRHDKRLSELPVVLVTALESRPERERGVDAGASAYIVKSSFDQSNLLETVRRLI